MPQATQAFTASVSANVRLDVQQQIDEIAESMQVSRADVVRILLQEALAAREAKRSDD